MLFPFKNPSILFVIWKFIYSFVHYILFSILSWNIFQWLIRSSYYEQWNIQLPYNIKNEFELCRTANICLKFASSPIYCVQCGFTRVCNQMSIRHCDIDWHTKHLVPFIPIEINVFRCRGSWDVICYQCKSWQTTFMWCVCVANAQKLHVVRVVVYDIYIQTRHNQPPTQYSYSSNVNVQSTVAWDAVNATTNDYGADR